VDHAAGDYQNCEANDYPPETKIFSPPHKTEQGKRSYEVKRGNEVIED